jgi:hypothetical protein
MLRALNRLRQKCETQRTRKPLSKKLRICLRFFVCVFRVLCVFPLLNTDSDASYSIASFARLGLLRGGLFDQHRDESAVFIDAAVHRHADVLAGFRH